MRGSNELLINHDTIKSTRMTEDIYDNRRNRIGRIEKKSDGSKDIYDSRGNRLGRYDARENKTYDARGNSFGPGDQLLRLLH